jgi:hypothetical protein
VLPLERGADLRRQGWITADTHVHFISPDTAALEGAAEGLDAVHLLASQWGDLFTNVGDFRASVREARASGSDERARVWVGSENRQHLLGHLSLLGLNDRLPCPITSGGPEESQIGDAAWVSLADWADEGRRQRAVVVVPHFPDPHAEVVANVIHGKVDALEIRDFAWGVDTRAVREWYRLLGAGYRVPVVGGTDKMSAGMPVGGLRTYARLDGPLTFHRFRDAVRAGRTQTTSGLFISLAVDGVEVGGEIPVGDGTASLDIDATAHSVLPLESLEIVHNGRVVARTTGDGRELRIRERLAVGVGWLAARALGPDRLWHEWPMRVAAHTSPVYLSGTRPEPDPGDEAYLDALLEGGLAWLDTLAAPASPARHRRLRKVFLDARRRLARRRTSLP